MYIREGNLPARCHSHHEGEQDHQHRLGPVPARRVRGAWDFATRVNIVVLFFGVQALHAQRSQRARAIAPTRKYKPLAKSGSELSQQARGIMCSSLNTCNNKCNNQCNIQCNNHCNKTWTSCIVASVLLPVLARLHCYGHWREHQAPMRASVSLTNPIPCEYWTACTHTQSASMTKRRDIQNMLCWIPNVSMMRGTSRLEFRVQAFVWVRVGFREQFLNGHCSEQLPVSSGLWHTARRLSAGRRRWSGPESAATWAGRYPLLHTYIYIYIYTYIYICIEREREGER